MIGASESMGTRLNRREFLRTIGLTAAAMAVPGTGATAKGNGNRLPNFVIVFIDDMGYTDIGPFGARGYETPNLNRMAAEGVRFTDFYAAASSCTPSRAALMTGCYPQRVGLPNVIGPKATIGISDKEVTIAQMLKPLGYATACYGKWHLGHQPRFLPMRHGFDEYFGLPYSNDMWPKHPERPTGYPDLPLVEGERVIAYNPDQTQLTTWYTERAVNFIEKNKDRPFFLYVPHSMCHVPLFVSDKFKGKSKQGLFGDVIMELDWSVGQILSTLKRLDLDDSTMVVGYIVRRRPARADDHAVAGQDSRRQRLRRARLHYRLAPDHRVADRRQAARAQDRREGYPAAYAGPIRGRESARGVLLLSRLDARSRAQRQVEAAFPARLSNARRTQGRNGWPARQVRTGEDRPGPFRSEKRYRRRAQRGRSTSGSGREAPAPRRRDAPGSGRRRKESARQRPAFSRQNLIRILNFIRCIRDLI